MEATPLDGSGRKGKTEDFSSLLIKAGAMTAVLSPSSSPTSNQFPPPNPGLSSLPPINTNPPPKRTTLQRPPSYARNRMSTYSTTSNNSQNRSRPPSYAFPTFHSSLPYALVRDFAYAITHPNHYGPPPETSAVSTPASEAPRRLSDPPNSTWDGADPQWSAGPWGGDGFFANQQLPQTTYGDGPPYSEDEDLHSPVVVSSRHKKHKSTSAALAGGQTRGKSRNPRHSGGEGDSDFNDRSYFANGSHMAHIGEGDENEGGDLVTYPPDQARQSLLAPSMHGVPGQRDSHFATLPNRSYRQDEIADSDDDSSLHPENGDDSRYSKDYQFTIASPDEEMHGKAVALFDFERENENELPLTEGQVIWVSYRHGQGWLVAEDPKTGESGLVPEEYVRLLRDIEGGWTSLSGEDPNYEDRNSPSPLSPSPTDFTGTPTQDDPKPGHSAHNSNGSKSELKENRPPVVSTFSTSSKDLSPYPHRLLEKERGQTPPQVVHYGSQNNTPTVGTSPFGVDIRRGVPDTQTLGDRKKEEEEQEGETEEETEESGEEKDSSREEAEEKNKR